MTYTPVLTQWPITHCPPINQTFLGARQPVVGGMTLGGAAVDNPEPGGRAVLLTDFAPFATKTANLAASWTMTMLQSGAIFAIPIYDSVQLLEESLITGAAAALFVSYTDPFTGDSLQRWDPFVPVTTIASKGAVTVLADFSVLGEVLRPGHLVGFRTDDYHFAHKVEAVTYGVADEATITISPPLRRNLAVDAKMRLRPMMLATCQNPESVIAPFRSGRSVGFGSARFVEALV